MSEDERGVGDDRHPNTHYVRSDGTFLFTTDGSGIVTSYPMNESVAGSSLNFWNALAVDWTSTATNCAHWTSAALATENCSESPNCGDVGWDSTPEATWITGGRLSCSETRPLACAEW